MNIVIINCFDTWEHRADLLYKILVQDGHRVSVLQSDFRHTDKQSRTKQKKDYIFFPAKPYTKNLSLARLQSHMQLSRDIFLFADRQAGQIDLMWVFAPPNSFVRGAGMVKEASAYKTYY